MRVGVLADGHMRVHASPCRTTRVASQYAADLTCAEAKHPSTLRASAEAANEERLKEDRGHGKEPMLVMPKAVHRQIHEFNSTVQSVYSAGVTTPFSCAIRNSRSESNAQRKNRALATGDGRSCE